MHKLCIVDADFLLWSATNGNKVLDEEGNPLKKDNKFVYTDKTLEEVFKAADDTLITILDKVSAEYYCGFLGACKSFRKDIYPDYKANRKDLVKPRYFDELKEYLYKKWRFTSTSDGLEADDAVNIVKNNLKNDYECIIVSSDKDLIKCIEGTYLNPRDLSIVNTSTIDAAKAFWKSMITGDYIDNIVGLKGRGEVYANSVIEFVEDHHTGYAMEVLDRYIRHFGEELGIEEFRKNYKCLKILDNFRTFVMPTLQSWQLSITRCVTSGNLDLEGIG
jgi:DNA polymerase-1